MVSNAPEQFLFGGGEAPQRRACLLEQCEVGGILCVESSEHFTVVEMHLDPKQPKIKHGPTQHF